MTERIIEVVKERTEEQINVIPERGERGITIERERITVTGAEPYTGEYTITPTQETQTLATENLRMTENLVINPIPSNYGRIEWNGRIIKVV